MVSFSSALATNQSNSAVAKGSSAAWEPQNPYLLYVFPESNCDGTDDGRAATTTPFGVSAKTGMSLGCNDHELASLRTIIAEHEEYHRTKGMTQALGEDEFLGATPTADHRALGQSYLYAVRDCLSSWNAETAGAINQPCSGTKDQLHWILLKRIYAVMHLSEIYLPLFSSPVSSREDSRRSNLFREDPVEIEGYATADTVRYLRLHEILTAEQSLNIPHDTLDAMLNAQYPEQNELYGSFLIALAKRGSLEQLWLVLTVHSLYRTNDKDIKEGFQLLQQVLRTAPLPGGRDSECDDRLDEMANDLPFQVEGLGVVPSDYLLWNSVDRSMGESMTFSLHGAIHKFREWRRFAEHVRQNCVLVHKFPAIKTMLAILCGDFSEVRFTTWAEHLCAELLYCMPERRPRTMTARVQKLQREYGQDDQISTVHIMNGDAGHAIVALYKWGGVTGVALASTLMALLFSLFVESGYIRPDEAEKKIDFVVEAAYDIQASLHRSQDSDVGAELAIRLLLPYTTAASEAEAVIANILEHYNPSMDDCALQVLSLVRNGLIERDHSVQILDGCSSIRHCLYNKHMKAGNAGLAAAFMLEGIDLEHAVLPQLSLGSCYRTLSKDCHAMSKYFLESVSGEQVGGLDATFYQNAKAVTEAYQQYCKMASPVHVPAMATLVSVLSLLASGANDSQSKVQGDCIAALLSKDVDGLHHAASSSIRMSSLHVAKKLIETRREASASTAESCPFSIQGMSLLLQQQLMTSERHNRATTATLQHGLLQALVAENAKLQTRERTRWDSQRKDTTADHIRYANLSELDSSAQMEFVQKKMLSFM